MIVQSAPEGEPHLVITMAEHTAFAGKMARAFGNETFEPVAPRDEMLFVVGNHDCGWVDLDADPGMDEETRLPYSLTRTPFERIIGTSARSPSVNEAHHPYCGLISSMHSWGLYNGRYGMSDRVLLDFIGDEHRPQVDAMLEGELERQARLKATLGEDPDTAPWVEDGHLFQNYKQLQFFDTMALYFNLTEESGRADEAFAHVPKSVDEDTTVEIRRVEPGVYGLAPYPFAEDGLEVSFTGRYMTPVPASEGPEVAARLGAASAGEETVRFVAG